jgi:hypothetical protein
MYTHAIKQRKTENDDSNHPKTLSQHLLHIALTAVATIHTGRHRE